MKRIGIRREDKSPFERRCPITPQHIRRAQEEFNLQFVIQPSPIRIFTDQEFVDVGAEVNEDLSSCDLILGVKEIPGDLLLPEMTYAFFSHTIKAQAYNMGMLRQLLGQGCTLVDYERIVDETNRRLVFFGYYAGLAGMIDTLWSLGQRLLHLGHETPLAGVKRAYQYHDLDEARAHLDEIGREIRVKGLPYPLQPMVVGVGGYGHVSRGAQSIFDHLPVKEITPAQLLDGGFDEGVDTARTLFKVVFHEEHMVRHRQDEGAFQLGEYYEHPERYKGVFERYLPHLSVLVNGAYWDNRYPRLLSLEQTRAMWTASQPPKLMVIGDISCDIDGSVQATRKATTIDRPVFVYDVDRKEMRDGVVGNGPVVMAIDILPAELPRDASRHFGDSLYPFLRQMAELDASVPFDKAAIQQEIRKAVIVWGGNLTPDYSYLEKHI